MLRKLDVIKSNKKLEKIFVLFLLQNYIDTWYTKERSNYFSIIKDIIEIYKNREIVESESWVKYFDYHMKFNQFNIDYNKFIEDLGVLK